MTRFHSVLVVTFICALSCRKGDAAPAASAPETESSNPRIAARVWLEAFRGRDAQQLTALTGFPLRTFGLGVDPCADGGDAVTLAEWPKLRECLLKDEQFRKTLALNAPEKAWKFVWDRAEVFTLPRDRAKLMALLPGQGQRLDALQAKPTDSFVVISLAGGDLSVDLVAAVRPTPSSTLEVYAVLLNREFTAVEP
jgi:hypothetical protein